MAEGLARIHRMRTISGW